MQQLASLALSVFLPAMTNRMDPQIWYGLEIKGGEKDFRSILPSLVFKIHSLKCGCTLVFEEKKCKSFYSILFYKFKANVV